MPPRGALTVPTAATLPSSLRLPPSHSSVARPLSRLSRHSLLSLVQEWLRASNQATCGPVLSDVDLDDESIYDPALTLEELREVYDELRDRKSGKREVVDRILEGDWRNGLSLKQLAMVDVQHLLDHPVSLRWTALKLIRVSASADDSGYETSTPDADDELPRLHGPTYLSNLQKEVGPLMKTHYHLTHLSSMPITLLRIYVHDSPYNNQASLTARGVSDASKTLFVAFPDNTRFVYVSFGSGGSSTDSLGIRKLILDAIPKAFSRPKERYVFKTTSLTARSILALVASRGPGNSNAAGGGWGMFADGSIEQSPLLPSSGLETQDKEGSGTELARRDNKRSIAKSNSESDVSPAHKKRKLLALRRFGNTAVQGDSKGLERLDLRIEDNFPQAEARSAEADTGAVPDAATAPAVSRRSRPSTLSMLEEESAQDDGAGADDTSVWKPQVQLTFHGSHVFAGIRSLVETGAVDGDKMPGWMTGEEGVSIGVVRNGRIRGHKGACN